MNPDLNMLNEIRQNAEMGRDGIMHAIRLTDDSHFRAALERQLIEYQDIFNHADGMLRLGDREPEMVGAFAKMSSYVTASIKSMTNSTTSKLAEIMIQESTMGVTNITKEIHEYSGSNRKILSLAEKLLKTEENNIEEMKSYL